MNLDQNVADAYHNWYAQNCCHSIMYRGVPIMKWIGDLWNYHDIIIRLKPDLIIEFGTALGGSALWFADLLENVNPVAHVITVDILDQADQMVRRCSNIGFVIGDSTSPRMQDVLMHVSRRGGPFPIFAILDSDHHKEHVLAEMELLRPILKEGDYLIVEDGNLNGHPIYANWGIGPYEAIEEYMLKYPNDYRCETEWETRFGFTFAPKGYLVRQ